MNNVLAFEKVLMKRNRQCRKVKMREVRVKYSTWSGHFEEQCAERNISESLVLVCLKKGRRVMKRGAIHYLLDNLHVVVSRDDETLITVYFKTDWCFEELDAA